MNPLTSTDNTGGAVRAPLRMLRRLEQLDCLASRVGDFLEVTCTQQHLATHMQISHGTLEKYLNALGPAVLCRRPLRFDLTQAWHPSGDVTPPSTSAGHTGKTSDPRVALLAAASGYWASISEIARGAAEAIRAADQPDTCIELSAGFADSLGHLTTQLADIHSQLHSVPDTGEGREFAPLAPPSRADSRPSRAPTRAPQSSQEGGRQDIQTSSLPSSGREVAPRAPDQGATGRDSKRPQGEGHGNVLQALEPLTEFCCRTQSGFDGITNIDGVLDALAGYTLDQVSHAARTMVAIAKTTPNLQNPIAVLCVRARHHDPVCFPDSIPFGPPPTLARRSDHEPQQDPPELSAAIATIRSWTNDPSRAPDLADLNRALPKAFVDGTARMSQQRRHQLTERELALILNQRLSPQLSAR